MNENCNLRNVIKNIINENKKYSFKIVELSNINEELIININDLNEQISHFKNIQINSKKIEEVIEENNR